MSIGPEITSLGLGLASLGSKYAELGPGPTLKMVSLGLSLGSMTASLGLGLKRSGAIE